MNHVWKVSSILAVLAALVVLGLSAQPTVHAQTPPAAVVQVVGTGTSEDNPSRSISFVCSDASRPGDGCDATDAQFEIAVTDAVGAGSIATVNDPTVSVDYDPSRKVVIQNLDLPRDTSAPRAEDRNPKTIYLGTGTTTFTVNVVRKSTGLTGDDVDRTTDPTAPVIRQLDPTDDAIQVKGFHGHRIRIAYSSGTGSIGTDTSVRVDDVKPVLVSNSPSIPLIVRGNTDITFSADITDALAGYTSTNTATAGINKSTGTPGTLGAAGSASTPKGGVRLVVAGNVIELDNTNFTKIDGGWRVTKTLGSSALQNISTNIPWYFETRDRAGNTRRTSGSISGSASGGGAVAGSAPAANTIVDRKFFGRLANAAFSGSSIRLTREDANGNPVVSNAQPIETPVTSGTPGTGFVGNTFTFTFENSLTDPLFGSAPDDITEAIPSVDGVDVPKAQFAINDYLYVCALAEDTANDALKAARAAATTAINDTNNTTANEVRLVAAVSTAVAASNTAQLGDCLSYKMGEKTTYQILASNLITVDSEKPTLDSAITGKGYNPVTTGDKPNVKNSIKLTFVDKGKAAGLGSDAPGSGLDPATVMASAFSVTGNSVVSASLQSGGRVYLTLADNLSSTATPTVSMAGSVIKDKAGNAADASRISKATDGLGPILSLSKSEDLSNSSVTITITTDEQLSEPPTVWLTPATNADGAAKIQPNGKAPASKDVGTPVSSGSVRQTGALSYTVTLRANANNEGEYSVFVRATDTATANNPGTYGDPASSSTAKAFSFELDYKLNDGEKPRLSVAQVKDIEAQDDGTYKVEDKAISVEQVDPLIVTLDFGKEGRDRNLEYHRDGYRTVELTSAKYRVTFDDGSFEDTTINLTTGITSPDDVKFTIPILNPKIGAYKLTVQARDSAGNVRLDGPGTTAEDLIAEWTVTKPTPKNIDLAPGWNLISLPFQPANPAINSVIGANHPVDIVMTYDNASQIWLVSRRDTESGLFTGDIAVLTANTAYFVSTKNFDPIKLLRPPLATAAAAPPPPPAITVVKGWNLVPVVSNDNPVPTVVVADQYFGTLGSGSNAGWLKALTFNTLSRTWSSVTPGDITVLRPGEPNPCTNQPLNKAKVEAGTETCQIGRYDERSLATGDVRPEDAVEADPTATPPVEAVPATHNGDGYVGDFDGSDTVTIGAPVTVGKGYWLYATTAGVIIP